MRPNSLRLAWGLAAALIAFLSARPPEVRAQDVRAKATAKEHSQQGMTAYNLGEFQEAVTAFEQAYRLDPSPILLFNLAKAHRQLGHGDRAAFYLRRYLVEEPKAKNRAQVEQWIRELEEAATRRQPVVIAPPSPAPLVSAPVLTPSAREPQSVNTPPTASDKPLHALETLKNHSMSDGETDERQPSTAWRRPASWVTAGLAVGALGVGLYQTVAYVGRRRDFNELQLETPIGNVHPCGKSHQNRGTDERCERWYDDAQTASTRAIVGCVLGGVLGAASAVLFLTAEKGDASSEQSAFVPRCVLLGTTGSCRVSF